MPDLKYLPAVAGTLAVSVFLLFHLPAVAEETNLSKTYNDNGCLEMMNQNYAESEKLFLAALNEATKTHDRKRTITSLTNLAALYQVTGRSSEAKELADKITRIKIEMNDVHYSSVPQVASSSTPTASLFSPTASPTSGASATASWTSGVIGRRSSLSASGWRPSSRPASSSPVIASAAISGRLRVIEFYADW